jgi:uncharacterized protein
MTNRLAQEDSPYLLQHKDNPVNWYPWGDEALAEARRRDRPIFLSIGYSACHWCHVMERESFSNEETAGLLNCNFVCVKVDREERPDIDAVYMDAISALTGRGGWPLSAWLTPDGAPFYGGTYFPDSPRYGAPSFRQVILAVADAWENKRSDINGSAEAIRRSLDQSMHRDHSATEWESVVKQALDGLASAFDPADGGWGPAPKFPSPMVIEFLLMRLRQEESEQIKIQVEKTLEAMAYGGVFDQLRGGFHRYSTDAQWLVPHFEKMLYDNAQLARCYLHAWQALGRDLYRKTAERTLDYLAAEMRHGLGGFFSSQDADSEGEEGTFFLWTAEEIRQALPHHEAESLMRTYGVTDQGNFEANNILHMTAPPNTASDARALDAARSTLLEARNRRTHPGRDEKIVSSWNGLTLAAFADAARAFQSKRYLDLALALAEFAARELVTRDFRVTHTWKDGHRGGLGFLEDYAYLADGFLALYEANFDERWLLYSRSLADRILTDFARTEGGFYDTDKTHERLLIRPRTLQDSPTPSGNAMAATLLLKLAALTAEPKFQEAAEHTLKSAPPAVNAAPQAFAQWLCAHELLRVGLTEIAVVGQPQSPPVTELLAVVNRGYRPFVVTAATPTGEPSNVAPLVDKALPAGTEAAAWICRKQTCSTAISNPVDMEEKLSTFP